MIVAAVNLDKKQNCFLFFVNVTIKSFLLAWGSKHKALRWPHEFVVFDLWPLTSHSCQKMEMLLQKIMAIHQHYRKDRMTGSMCLPFLVYTLLLFLYMFKLTIPSCFLYLSTELAYNDEQIHKFEKWVCDVLLTLPVKDVILSSPVICLSLFHPRLHLSAHIKRVKSLLKDDCVQRYKELLASTRTWSRSEPPLESFSHVKQSSDLPQLPTTTTIYSQWDNCLLDVMMEAYMEISTGL